MFAVCQIWCHWFDEFVYQQIDICWWQQRKTQIVWVINCCVLTREVSTVCVRCAHLNRTVAWCCFFFVLCISMSTSSLSFELNFKCRNTKCIVKFMYFVLYLIRIKRWSWLLIVLFAACLFEYFSLLSFILLACVFIVQFNCWKYFNYLAHLIFNIRMYIS